MTECAMAKIKGIKGQSATQKTNDRATQTALRSGVGEAYT